MAKKSKRLRAALAKVVPDPLPLAEAVAKLQSYDATKFDQSVEIAIRLGIDHTQADQIVRGSIVLPHGIGKQQRVVVFAKGPAAEEAKEAGADFVGDDDLAKKIKDGWTDFDACIAAPDMMKLVGPLGRVLGPRGLMPNPKLGTVTPNVGQAVGEQKAGKVEYRVDKSGIIHCSIGKRSLDAQAIVENASELIHTVQKARPATTKGVYMKKITVSTTMGPGLKVDPSAPLAVDAA